MSHTRHAFAPSTRWAQFGTNESWNPFDLLSLQLCKDVQGQVFHRPWQYRALGVFVVGRVRILSNLASPFATHFTSIFKMLERLEQLLSQPDDSEIDVSSPLHVSFSLSAFSL